MPALITHHLFGERAAGTLPQTVIGGEEELLAFLLGNQGPDPFFFRTFAMPARASVSHAMAHRMHDERMTSAFLALREGVSHLPEHDAGIGRAYAMGMLGHYALDRTAHPFIYAQQFALIEAAGELEAASTEVHAVIESDLDSFMLWRLRHATVHDCPPAGELARTERICRVAGALTSQVAWATFGLKLPATEFGASVADMELCYRAIEPWGSAKNRALDRLERLARPYSQLHSLSHRVIESDECPAANLGHDEWRNPSTGARSRDSFVDRFERALAGYPELAEAFTHGGDELRAAVGGLNYSGIPLGADEICPPEARG